MKITDSNEQRYKNILVYTMQENNNNSEPVYLRRIDDKKYLSPPHRHEAVQINYVVRGKLIHIIGNSQCELVKGDIFIIPPYIPHQLLAVENTEFEIMELNFTREFVFDRGTTAYQNGLTCDCSYIEPFLDPECGVKPRINLTGKNQIEEEKLLNEIYTEYADREEGYLLSIKVSLIRMLVLLRRHLHSDEKPAANNLICDYQKESIVSSLQYIQEHYAEDISVEQVSRIATLSPSYYSHLFKIVTQKTFVEYVNFLRIEKSMDMLKNTGDLVVNICFECGFKNVNHFNRTFKNIVGIPPTKYRKSQRKDSGQFFLLGPAPILTA